MYFFGEGIVAKEALKPVGEESFWKIQESIRAQKKPPELTSQHGTQVIIDFGLYARETCVSVLMLGDGLMTIQHIQNNTMRKNNKSMMGASKHMSVKFNKFAQRNFKEYKNFVNTIVDCETQEVFTIDEKLGTIQEVSKMVAPLVIWENFKSLMETSGLICRKEDRISFGNAENVEFISTLWRMLQ